MHAGPMAKNHGALPETLKVGTNELGLVHLQDVTINFLTEILSYTRASECRQGHRDYSYASSYKSSRHARLLRSTCRGPRRDHSYRNPRKWLKFSPVDNMEIRPKVVILEMLGTTVSMIVHDIERIRRIKWDQIKVPPALLQANTAAG